MPEALVLIDSETGYEGDVIKELRHLPEVTEAYALTGVYDILAKVREDGTKQELKDVVSSKIRRIDGIRSTITMFIYNKE